MLFSVSKQGEIRRPCRSFPRANVMRTATSQWGLTCCCAPGKGREGKGTGCASAIIHHRRAFSFIYTFCPPDLLSSHTNTLQLNQSPPLNNTTHPSQCLFTVSPPSPLLDTLRELLRSRPFIVYVDRASNRPTATLLPFTAINDLLETTLTFFFRPPTS